MAPGAGEGGQGDQGTGRAQSGEWTIINSKSYFWTRHREAGTPGTVPYDVMSLVPHKRESVAVVDDSTVTIKITAPARSKRSPLSIFPPDSPPGSILPQNRGQRIVGDTEGYTVLEAEYPVKDTQASFLFSRDLQHLVRHR